jgi:hypothetical protein
MADKKISQLTAASTPLSGTEVLPIVQGGSTVRVPVSDLTAGRAVSVLSATLTGGTANGVVYLNASKETTSGTGLVFNGTNLGVGVSPSVRLHTKSSAAENVRIEGTTARGGGSVYGTFYDPTGRKGFWGYAASLDDTFFVANEMNAPLAFQTNAITRASITGAGNFCAGAQSALATTATNGFLYVPTCAGTPTGTPTGITGMVPIVVDTTNNKLYFYSTGVWRDAGP